MWKLIKTLKSIYAFEDFFQVVNCCAKKIVEVIRASSQIQILSIIVKSTHQHAGELQMKSIKLQLEGHLHCCLIFQSIKTIPPSLRRTFSRWVRTDKTHKQSVRWNVLHCLQSFKPRKLCKRLSSLFLFKLVVLSSDRILDMHKITARTSSKWKKKEIFRRSFMQFWEWIKFNNV